MITVALADAGRALRTRCACLPDQLVARVAYPPRKLAQLKGLLDELVGQLQVGPGEGRAAPGPD